MDLGPHSLVASSRPTSPSVPASRAAVASPLERIGRGVAGRGTGSLLLGLVGLALLACGSEVSTQMTSSLASSESGTTPTGTGAAGTGATGGATTSAPTTTNTAGSTSDPAATASGGTTAPSDQGGGTGSIPGSAEGEPTTDPGGGAAPGSDSDDTTAPIDLGGDDDADDSSAGGEDPVEQPAGPSNPSGLPEPGEGGVARPSGAAGNLRVLAWAGFAAAITYTFDDSNSTQIQNYDRLNGPGVPYTFYMQTGKREARDPVWARALEDGHELGNHTQSHQSSGNLGPDTDAASAFIQDNYGVTAYTMAAPNGATGYIDVARTRFLINRGVSDGQINPGGDNDPFNLQGNIPPTGAGASHFNPKIDRARSAGAWQIFTLHGFSGGSDGAYQPVSLDGFMEGVEYAVSFGDVWIGTMENVGAYWLGQKAFDASPPSGDTWTWTLPDNFPPGKYLRVIVDGGTPTQNGAALPWNDHGFYEVALDAGSLTLAP